MSTLESSHSVVRCALVNLGCRVNHAEIEAMRLALEDENIAVTDSDKAQVVVVNTCAVTGEAEAKSRKAIRRLASRPSIQTIYVTGCAVNLFEEEFTSLADNVVHVPNKRCISERIKRDALLHSRDGLPQKDSGGPAEPVESFDSNNISPARMRREIKIQDGCNNACSYCIVRVARGPSHSVPVQEILQQTRRASSDGIGEIVLAGINLGQFRLDEVFTNTTGAKADATSLATLIHHLLDELPLARIRLSSIEPTDIDPSLIDLMAQNPQRIAAYLHIPLQSGSNTILKAMGRPYTVQDFQKTVNEIRHKLPHIALATDIIVGFPGETDENFTETYEFAKRLQFSKIHLFRYSLRPGTPAANRADHIAPEIKAERAHKLQKLADAMRSQHAQDLKGSVAQVYVESHGRGKSEGLFEVKVPKEVPLGTIYAAPVSDVRGDCLICQ